MAIMRKRIDDMIHRKSFLDPRSEFSGINDLAIKALKWKTDKLSNFTIKGNSKHITDLLGWYTDVPVTLRDKEDKTVMVIRNFVHIDNSETELMLFLGPVLLYKSKTFSEDLVDEIESECCESKIKFILKIPFSLTLLILFIHNIHA
ncbi:hypothetical protein C1645_733330 [Glomus cerebriforme]|uniref:Uncharacterized protein n=1 Tax=Glomus cerebriforme TaxID=658196 RepID=A0A397THD8_9GLOM|nr:hypothetical protein C1645_733330 [Glomus cerebriforme]